MREYGIGLALSGGSAKGIAHIGALRALHELGIRPEILSGVSAGAIVAAMYADGISLSEMLAFYKRSQLSNMANVNWSVIKGKSGGLASFDPFKEKLRKVIKARTFEDLQIPIVVTATDLELGESVNFESGELVDRLIASSSIPMMFRPAKIDGRLYIDGGIVSNLAATPIRSKCDYLIGIHVNPVRVQKMTSGFFDVANRTFDLVINGSSTEAEKRLCDIIIETPEAGKYGMTDSAKADELAQIGYDATMKALSEGDTIEKLRAANKK